MGLFDRSFFDNETFPRIEWLDSELIDTTQVSAVGVGTTGEENVGAFTSNATSGASSVGVDGSAAGATGIAITLVVALVGVDGSAVGAFSSTNALDVNPVGVDGSAIGAFTSAEALDVSLVGVDTSASGAFTSDVIINVAVTLVGVDGSAPGAPTLAIQILPPPPPPGPPPPLPALVKPYGSEAQASGGPLAGRGFEVRLPLDRLDVDYALFPVGDARVLALADGTVEMIVDERSRTFVRLTADDGTQYIYAGIKVPTSKPRRVKKGDLIGTARSGKASEPRRIGSAPPLLTVGETVTSGEAVDAAQGHLPVPSEPSASHEGVAAPPAVFGVMPVVRQRQAPPPFVPRASLVFAPPTLAALPPAPPPPAALPPSGPLTMPEKIVLGVGAAALLFVIYKWIASSTALPPRRRKRKKSKPQPRYEYKSAPQRRQPPKRKRAAAEPATTTGFREARRLKAVKMVLRGKSIGDVAEHFDVSHEAVRKWVAWYENDGVKALKAFDRPGPQRQVPLAKLRAILSRNADLSLSQIAEVLYEKTGVRYSRAHIARLLDEI